MPPEMHDGRRRICFVLPSLNGGGAERAAVQILNGLDPERWDRSMFLFAREGPYLSEVDPAIRIASAESASRWGRWRALRTFVAGERPEIVMAFLSFFSVLTAARHTYKRAGFSLTSSEKKKSFGQDVVSEHWDMTL